MKASSRTYDADFDVPEDTQAATVSPESLAVSMDSNISPTSLHTPACGYTFIDLRSYQFTGAVDKWLDERFENSPRHVTTYVQEIYAFFRANETKFRVNENYVFEHSIFNASVRFHVVDWLISVHWKLRLHPETLFLAVNILDRFMETNRNVKKKALNLIALACLSIAAKQEEVDPPSASDYESHFNGEFKEVSKQNSTCTKYTSWRVQEDEL